jgi:raffinose/stachyose/melibiose transport system permease protein
MTAKATPTQGIDRAASAGVQSGRNWERTQPWLLAAPFLAPALIFYVLFMVIPLAGTLLLSVTEWTGFNFADIKFIGTANFAAMGSDPIFWQSLLHNGLFLLGGVILKTSFALAMALALEQNVPFSKLFRGIYLMPAVLSLVVVSVVFSLALSPSLGLINPFLQAIGLGSLAGGWLGNPQRALPILIVIDLWHGFGLYMFLFIARLAAIDQELHEAAFVDGANGFQDIRHITIPLLRSTTMMVLLLAAIDSLKLFANVYVMTNGGPNHRTEVLSTWAYFQAFTANRVGYGSAILVVLLVITFILAYIQTTRVRPQQEY